MRVRAGLIDFVGPWFGIRLLDHQLGGTQRQR